MKVARSGALGRWPAFGPGGAKAEVRSRVSRPAQTASGSARRRDVPGRRPRHRRAGEVVRRRRRSNHLLSARAQPAGSGSDIGIGPCRVVTAGRPTATQGRGMKLSGRRLFDASPRDRRQARIIGGAHRPFGIQPGREFAGRLLTAERRSTASISWVRSDPHALFPDHPTQHRLPSPQRPDTPRRRLHQSSRRTPRQQTVSYICSVNRNDVIRGEHTRVCFAGALGEARRGRPPEDWAVSEDRAVQLLADDPTQCTCPRRGRQGRTRARGWTAEKRS